FGSSSSTVRPASIRKKLGGRVPLNRLPVRVEHSTSHLHRTRLVGDPLVFGFLLGFALPFRLVAWRRRGPKCPSTATGEQAQYEQPKRGDFGFCQQQGSGHSRRQRGNVDGVRRAPGAPPVSFWRTGPAAFYQPRARTFSISTSTTRPREKGWLAAR